MAALNAASAPCTMAGFFEYIATCTRWMVLPGLLSAWAPFGWSMTWYVMCVSGSAAPGA